MSMDFTISLRGTLIRAGLVARLKADAPIVRLGYLMASAVDALITSFVDGNLAGSLDNFSWIDLLKSGIMGDECEGPAVYYGHSTFQLRKIDFT